MKYKFSVYVIFDENQNYMMTVTNKELKEKVLNENEKAKFFMKLDVQG